LTLKYILQSGIFHEGQCMKMPVLKVMKIEI